MLSYCFRAYSKLLVVESGNALVQAMQSATCFGFDPISIDVSDFDEYEDVLDVVKFALDGENIESIYSTFIPEDDMISLSREFKVDMYPKSIEKSERNMVHVTQIDDDVQGLTVEWDDGQFVVIVCPTGLVACGAIDNEVLEKFGFAVTVSQGTPEHPLVYPEDLLGAKIVRMTEKAESFGIHVGMSGEEALELLKNADVDL